MKVESSTLGLETYDGVNKACFTQSMGMKSEQEQVTNYHQLNVFPSSLSPISPQLMIRSLVNNSGLYSALDLDSVLATPTFTFATPPFPTTRSGESVFDFSLPSIAAITGSSCTQCLYTAEESAEADTLQKTTEPKSKCDIAGEDIVYLPHSNNDNGNNDNDNNDNGVSALDNLSVLKISNVSEKLASKYSLPHFNTLYPYNLGDQSHYITYDVNNNVNGRTLTMPLAHVNYHSSVHGDVNCSFQQALWLPSMNIDDLPTDRFHSPYHDILASHSEFTTQTTPVSLLNRSQMFWHTELGQQLEG